MTVLGLVTFAGLGVAHTITQLTAPAARTVPVTVTESYPTSEAGAFAVQAAVAWLRLDGTPGQEATAGPAVRREMLDAVTTLPGDLGHTAGGQSGWGLRPTQITVVAVDPLDGWRATVRLAVQITGQTAPAWIGLAVPVAHDGAGGWALAGTPAVMPAPRVIGTEPGPRPPADQALAEAMADPVDRFFQAWTASDTAALGYVLADDVDPAAIGGLDGAFDYAGLERLYVPELATATEPRLVAATVVLVEPISGNRITTTYALRMRLVGERWQVTAVDVAPGEHPTTPTTPPVPSE